MRNTAHCSVYEKDVVTEKREDIAGTARSADYAPGSGPADETFLAKSLKRTNHHFDGERLTQRTFPVAQIVGHN